MKTSRLGTVVIGSLSLFWFLVTTSFMHVVGNNTPGVAITRQKILKIIKGRPQQRGRGTDAETVINECSDEVNLVLSRCK